MEVDITNGFSEQPREPEAVPALAQPSTPRRSARQKTKFSRSALLGGVVLGSVAALLGFAALWLIRTSSQQERIPTLTRAAYEQAVARWEAHGPASYDMDVEIRGRRAGQVQIEVRNGEVTQMARDGHTPQQRRTWDYWTVPTLLDTIGQELDMAADPVAGFHAPAGSVVVQQAEFDPTLGYPRRYRRLILGTPLDVEWIVMRFEAVPSTQPDSAHP